VSRGTVKRNRQAALVFCSKRTAVSEALAKGIVIRNGRDDHPWDRLGKRANRARSGVAGFARGCSRCRRRLYDSSGQGKARGMLPTHFDVDRLATMRGGPRGSILPAVKNREQSVLKTAQLQQATSGDYLGGRAARRFAGTTLRCLVTGFLVSAASNNCRNPCANSSTAFPKAPSCPTRTIATDRCRSNDGGRNTFTGSIE
jgi:hypothetical protein